MLIAPEAHHLKAASNLRHPSVYEAGLVKGPIRSPVGPLLADNTILI